MEPIDDESIHDVTTSLNDSQTIEFTCTYTNIHPRLGLEVLARKQSGSMMIANKEGSAASEKSTSKGTVRYSMSIEFN